MKERNVFLTLVFSIITFGIYLIVWFVKTKGELNQKGASIPTAWLLIIPFVNIWWMWKYYEGAEQVTNGKVNAILNFLLGFFVTALIPQALCQNEYNKLGGSAEPAAAAPAPEAPSAPATPPAEPAAAAPEQPPENQQSAEQPAPPEPTPPAENPPSTDDPKPPLVQ